jgi:hypothetical protein
VKHAFNARGSAPNPTLFPLQDFTVPGNSATVFHKRPRGRPSGPRGFIFRVPGPHARTAFDCAVDLHSRARRNAVSALVARRSRGERDAFGHAEAIHGRQTLHFSFACVLAGFLRLRGGVL